ncbi:protein arginine N-methyltransferase [Leucogyrophana mollusca]|uniref:Protein arginine N-methyltransferase n=1 Tax=Leucogyrophana mollusca TaxID=85980 RepID=A0ACB8BTN3_9AGAM|nr:protein arginine N-methyltransferase [Leucogyrophana mollusca]
MSIHLPAPSSATFEAEDPDSQSESESSNDADSQDNNFEGWDSDDQQRPCRSLFDVENGLFPTAQAALAHDRDVYGFDLDGECARLKLDLHSRLRLINFIRKHRPTPKDITNLTGAESLFASDEYLIPVFEDDPLLQLESDSWSDDDDDEVDGPASPQNLPSAMRRIQLLERKLADAKRDIIDYRSLVTQKLDVSRLAEIVADPGPSGSSAHDSNPPPRDDDSHYFQSYGENDIHAVMIQDKVRTSTYASFILTNPILFRDAVVLDVGCGTGILSLFAAKSGAKHVYAVDASDIAEKAEAIVKANGLEDVITVIRGKVEEISLPDGVTQVDIIISEWMGYALLYESMLDSVLHARDRFLRPDSGVMAPSQCRIMLALCEGSEILKERVEFWNDVYGFDLSTMAKDLYGEAIVDVVGPDSMVSAPYLIKDLHLSTITTRHLSFTSPFTLISTTAQRTKIHAFVLYFDTFFTTTSAAVPPSTPVRLIREGDVILAEVWPVGGKPPPQRRASMGEGLKLKAREDRRVISFSTGPTSQPTHWKQTVFLLREPIHAEDGTIVTGTFDLRKSADNSRELDVEIHYSVRKNAEADTISETVVQMYKVR